MISQRSLIAVLVGVLGALAATPDAHAQALPTPNQLVSGLDLECYRTPGPSMEAHVALTHLNPVMQELNFPAHQVVIKELAQTCVPVRKNNAFIPPEALSVIRHIDFACFRIEAEPLAAPVQIKLTHLNPLLAGLPSHRVWLERPAQLCLPMAKNDKPVPPEVLPLVGFIDLECYETDPDPHPSFTRSLAQLNPQLTGIPQHLMTLDGPRRQLCVPVRKGMQGEWQQIPADTLKLIRWIDLEKFEAQPSVFIAPVPVTLHHLNPFFAGRPSVPVVLQEANSLLVPVAKNDRIPPNGAP